MLLTTLVVPKFRVSGLIGALILVFALAVANSLIWDASLFSQVPHALSIKSLLLLLANGVFFYIIAELVPGTTIGGLPSAIAAAFVYTLCSTWILHVGTKASLDTLTHGVNEIKGYFEQPEQPSAEKKMPTKHLKEAEKKEEKESEKSIIPPIPDAKFDF